MGFTEEALAAGGQEHDDSLPRQPCAFLVCPLYACRLEALAAKQFDGDYGYLTGPISPLTPTGERPYAVGIAKYAGPSGMLIKTKRCPLVPKDKVRQPDPACVSHSSCHSWPCLLPFMC